MNYSKEPHGLTKQDVPVLLDTHQRRITATSWSGVKQNLFSVSDTKEKDIFQGYQDFVIN